MSIIKVMDEALSNKIAAGEVVERPRSIVKELVENALDAGGKTIKITIEQSGIRKIIVEDNGSGMAHEDALLAFQRHATSKIFSEADLFQIKSLGFRGEALAAIASVSNILLETGKDDEPSTVVSVKGGEIVETQKDTSRQGTKITVSSLFYNTPARLKHLRSLQTEYVHIMEYLQKMAIARPNVRFEFYSDGKEVFKTYGTNKLSDTMVMIYGEKIASLLLPMEAENEDFIVSGFITKPQAQRSNQRVINLSINKRSVRHYGINRAILAGYSTLIPKGTYPIVALDITVDAQLVDVNVHPSKLEVRLSKERELEDLIKRSIQKALIEENLIYRDVQMPRKMKTTEQMGLHLSNPEEQMQKKSNISYPTGGTPLHESQSNYSSTILSRKEQKNVKELYNNYERMTDNPQALPVKETPQGATDAINFTESSNEDTNNPSMSVEISAFEQQPVQSETVPATIENVVQPQENDAVNILRELTVIGQYDATYILAQRDTSLYLIDQHAAQERIKYEENMARVRNMERVATQELLFPLTLRLEPVEVAAVKDFTDELVLSGIELEQFGMQDVRVIAVPHWLKKNAVEEYVRKTIDLLVEHRSVDNALIREKELIMLSCKYSIKAHDVLNMDEMRQLIYRLSEMEVPFTCPHGRPITIEHTKYEVERWFKRA